MDNKPKIVVEIDRQSGFCFGVVNAISQAEEELKVEEPLYCLGEIVHNSEEVDRLKRKGLVTISHNDLDKLKGKKVLLRAHGEPPSTYKKAIEKGIQIIDASCPVVLKLQVKVRDAWERMQREGGQIVIFGKKGHAEVAGLVGQAQGNAIVIESASELDILDFTKHIELFAQTTKSSDEYKALAEEIRMRMEKATGNQTPNFKLHNSICGQVANRKNELKVFAARFDAVVFVSGKNSSNGKMLFEVCKTVNPNTFFISASNELNPEWFNGAKTVGVCGATSTPLWLMEEVAAGIVEIDKTSN
jgi:4-hydroxy-3-methylbut-2-enyl diphosphate reductase